MTDKTGGAAFPVPATELHGTTAGMTLRDYFAAKFMQAAKSNPNCGYDFDDLAHDAYQMADAMLKARG
ncbi:MULTISPECIES: hypothetical protein [Morganellaceae]|uniref:hypothetical protein n=1 Tax=Morganellaceae TaxID=1903414 RepID=UPI000CE66E84|nr:hypothetical protein [Proteus terrae]AVE42434.1 hypothetical protein AM353_11710 [Providencia stuartii]QPB11292.1 hypothetical protein [Providencia phage PSTNGR2lys]